jgi:hypothetical protein
MTTPTGAEPWTLIVQEEQEQDCDLVVFGRQDATRSTRCC